MLQLDTISISNIFEWLPSRFLVTRCMLVSRGWRNVIEESKSLKFDLSIAEWCDFLQLCNLPLKETVIERCINTLSIKSRFGQPELRACGFDSLVNLKSLSLRGVRLDSKFIDYVEKKTNIPEISICDCVAVLDKVLMIMCSKRQISMFLGGYDKNSVMNIEEANVILSVSSLRAIGSNGHPRIRMGLRCSSSIGVLLCDASTRHLPGVDEFQAIDLYSVNPEERGIDKKHIAARYDDKNAILNSLLYQPGDIIGLKVGDCSLLTEEDKKSFMHMKDLRGLYLSNYTTGMFELPLSNLECLELNNCVISEDDASAIGNILSLKKLSIRTVAVKHKSSAHRRFELDDLCEILNGVPQCRLKKLINLAVYCSPDSVNNLSALSGMSYLSCLKLESKKDTPLTEVYLSLIHISEPTRRS